MDTSWYSLVDTNSIIYKAAAFVANEMIEGDYLEFGCFRGGSFIAAHLALTRAFDERTQANTWSIYEHEAVARRRQYAQMRYIAFDSFQGLPKPEGLDSYTAEFEQGK